MRKLIRGDQKESIYVKRLLHLLRGTDLSTCIKGFFLSSLICKWSGAKPVYM